MKSLELNISEIKISKMKTLDENFREKFAIQIS